MRWQVLLTLVVLEIIILVCGGLIFWALESRSSVNVSQQLIDDFLSNHTCVTQSELESLIKTLSEAKANSSSSSKWDVSESIFFAMTVVSTIGYGNLVPTTGGSRAFCCVYALIGIPITLVMLFGIGERLNRLSARLEQRIIRKRPRVGKIARSLFIFSLGFSLFILLPAVGFIFLEDWSYGVSVYYGIITLATIGFGDYAAGFKCVGPLCPLYRIAVGIWIYVGLAWLSGFISSLQESITVVVKEIDESEPLLQRCRNKMHRGRGIRQSESTEPERKTDGTYTPNLDSAAGREPRDLAVDPLQVPTADADVIEREEDAGKGTVTSL